MAAFAVRNLALPDLAARDVAAWHGLQAASARRSPLTSYDFARLSDAAHGDVRVILAGEGEQPELILPFHARANRFARPLGAVFSDIHGPLVAEGFTASFAQVLARAGVSAYRFAGLEETQLLAGAVAGYDTAFAIDLDAAPDAYIAARRSLHQKYIKNYQRLEAKLQREHGELAFIVADDSDAHVDALMRWKRDQLARTARFDILGVSENRLMLALARGLTGDLAGLMLTLTLNGQPIAAHFGVRLGDHYHPWIAAYDPAWATFSPGMILIRRAIEAMPQLGLKRYELGVGHAQYKRLYANSERALGQGVVFGVGVHAAAERAGEAMGRSFDRIDALRRLRRRADLIAAAEPRPHRRAAALADALLRRARFSGVEANDG